jgi:vancomycin aglycone glucosyltransferase
MRILLAPHGTRGDVQPMLALADALADRGHIVRFVAPANFVPWIGARGFAAHSDGIDVEELFRTVGANVQSLRWQAHYLSQVLTPQLFESVATASADVDLIVGAGVQVAGASIAEWRDLPYCNVGFCPCVVPSSETPPPLVKTQTLPKWVNGLLWQIGRPVTNLLLRGPINAARKRLALDPLDSVLAHLLHDTVMVAADRDLAPIGADAPPGTVQTDAWIDRDPAVLDSHIESFLRLDPPPIYIGFGSMVARDVGALASDAIVAARALGRPAIVAGGWSGLDRRLRDGEDLCVVDAVPHNLLLPRVAVAVHHGGAGTTTAAARAGVPQVVLPHILDQFYWAHRVEVLGLGPAGLPVEVVNAEVLTDRISIALTDPWVRDAAAAFAPGIASRNGVQAAVDTLEKLRAEF